MAHQQLKFQVDPTKSEIWQPVLGGQAHGTFFMVYMKFHDFEEHNHDDNGNYFYKCSFKLQNYRGAITIGLADIERETIQSEVEELKDKGSITHIRVKVQPFKKNDLIPERVLMFSNKIEKEMLAVIQLELLNPPDSLFDSNDLDNSLYINPYTHFRDGDEFDEVARRKVGTTSWQSGSNMAGIGTGFCLPDIFWFWWW